MLLGWTARALFAPTSLDDADVGCAVAVTVSCCLGSGNIVVHDTAGGWLAIGPGPCGEGVFSITMGIANSMPVVPLPKPTIHRAVVCLEPQPVSRYFKQPWRRANMHLRVVGSVRDFIPVALDGVVPDPVYIETIAAVDQRAKNFRVLGFFVDRSIQ
ncbi:hypothetical protein THAOC_14469 [Thalassiosira oceanica]|uniref:Uncharacterized protein n=1 Tax=Thalassiosira oceanica TaxID=159749 RepID=K0SHG9_THAOC|nr:hypothetical protein THAOC_14469 [Thalassiosira oceanica]|eukprot:EJK64765.1 hypothetical protein THAOC_14469 [Thalassiosira oceanica]